MNTEKSASQLLEDCKPKHAQFGPSSLKNRELCPGWRPDRNSDTSAADEGTMMHLAAETGDVSRLNAEQLDCVTKCLNYTAPYEKGALEILKETRLDILDGLTFGTADRVVIRELPSNSRGQHAHLLDWKFGRAAIDDAEYNRQGWAYLLGIFAKFPAVELVTVHFLVPRRDEILRHTFKRSDIPRIELVIRTIIERCKTFDETKDPSMLNPSEHACLYCGAKGKCPKLHDSALTLAKKYAPLEVVDETHSSQITDPNEMAKALTLARILEKWCESVKKHANDFVNNGAEIPGYERAERAGTREINNPILALPVLQEFLTPEEIISASKLSISKLEKFVSDKAARGQKQKQIANFNRKLIEHECVTNGESTTYLKKIRE